VSARRLLLASLAALALTASSAAASAPLVHTMVIGAGGAVLAQPRTVAAGATTVHVGSRTCAVSAGTPLAGLAALARSGGPQFSLRDYGHCGRSAANSGQLFVFRVGGETNHGQDGWEYKVDSISGTTGAGDASGPLGNGRRMRSGDRLLWFWCEAAAGGCQSTLELGAPTSVRRGQTFAVYVRGYDNFGHSAPIGGVTVRFGSRLATTAPGGKATLVAPRSGGVYQLGAARTGLVPAFPRTIAVR
jgi:hypothetical protein